MTVSSPETLPLDELELELRRLSGVSYVGFQEEEGALVVQLLAVGANDVGELRERAARLSRAHVAGPVIVEVDTGHSADEQAAVAEERVEILAVLPSIDALEVEVHLAYAGLRTVGRGQAGVGPVEAAAATLEALRSLRLAVPYKVLTASSLSGGIGDAVVVVLGHEGTVERRFGIAAGKTDDEAAARATLQALNRSLAPRPGSTPQPARH